MFPRFAFHALLLAHVCLTSAAFAQPLVKRESFFVGGRYAEGPTGKVMQGQMYVEAWTPARVTHSVPLVFIHGNGQTAMNWMATPDGRKAWAEAFAEKGWKVVLVEQPGRGRSAGHVGTSGPTKAPTVAEIERFFTAPESFNDYPQAKLHTQWPGGRNAGRPGQPAFDQFYASQVPLLDRGEAENQMRLAGSALLDRIGPAVLVVHSQAGLMAWQIADARPELVKAIVALEPSGPPFFDVRASKKEPDRPWGLTATPLTYDPPVTPEAPLEFEQQAVPDAPNLTPCWDQKGTPRKLTHLSKVPLMIAVTEASYHAMYDHCTSRFLTRAGISHDFVRLADKGILGNGHMMMLEMNHLEIAAFIDQWLSQRVH